MMMSKVKDIPPLGDTDKCKTIVTPSIDMENIVRKIYLGRKNSFLSGF